MMHSETNWRIAFLMMSIAGIVELGTASAFAGDILKNEKKIYSYGNEELIIRDSFNDKRGGVFLDVGAYHYEMVSTTYYLEKELGWTGIGVDALAEFALGYLQNRPSTRSLIPWFPIRHGMSKRFIGYPGPNMGLYSTNQSWLDMFYNRLPDTREWIDKKPKIFLMTITLADLLDKNGVT